MLSFTFVLPFFLFLTVSLSNGAPTSTAGPTAGPNACPTPNHYFVNGTIQSSNYPVQYSNNLNCDYYLAVPLPGTITIKFGSDFSTEKCCDIVTLYDGDSKFSSVIARLSGRDGANKQFTSSTNVMLVNFHTDATITDKGWSAYFNVTTGEPGICSNGSVSVGPCVADLCPIGYVCNLAFNECCAATATVSLSTG